MSGEIAGKGHSAAQGVRLSELLRAGYQGRVSGYQAIWQGMRSYRAAAGRAQAEAAPSQEEGQSDHVICQSPLFPARQKRREARSALRCGCVGSDSGWAGARPEGDPRATALSSLLSDVMSSVAFSFLPK